MTWMHESAPESRSLQFARATMAYTARANLGNRALQRKIDSPAASSPTVAPPIVHDVIASAGHPLDRATRRTVEARLGHDFSRVQVHRDTTAGRSTDAVGARAFTVGDHVVIHPDEYRPGTVEGRRLLTHELVHVIQQEHTPRSDGARIPIASASDSAEREANVAEKEAEQTNQTLRSNGTPQLSQSAPILQRQIKKVATWGGEFLLDEYAAQVGEDNPDVNGATITMHFQPNDLVDAEEIAFIQTARGIVDERPRTKDYGNDAAQKTAESRNIPKGETGQGTHIDQMPYSRTPVGGMKKEGGDTLAGPTPNKKYTEIGWHYHDPSGKLQTSNAMFHDEPNLVVPPTIEQAQEFETAAVALKGKQQGVYYGSVEWGWYKYPSQKVPQLQEFKARSKDAPSRVFQQAGQMWNASRTTDGKSSIQVPAMDMYRIREATPLFEGAGAGKQIGQLSKDVRVGETDLRESGANAAWINVIVVDGQLAGKRGWISRDMIKTDQAKGRS